ncbi:MAG: IS1595 family transposase [Alphaproteobacteria bacterium]|nr:IS1595 family transposase [Alphaproteobacteria bacterium]
MSKSALSRLYLHDEKAAYAFVESQLWADGRPCPHCGVLDESTSLKGKSTRMGVYKCRACRKPFTVKVGTVFEGSNIKLHIWLQAIFLLSSSKKGISSNQLHRALGITLKSAWFLSHRIREAMTEGGFDLLGGAGEVVEADETYYGKKSIQPTETTTGRPFTSTGKGAHKIAVVSLVQRGGKVRSFKVDRADKATVARIVLDNVDRASRLHTDESRLYMGADAAFVAHETVRHRDGEYGRGDVTTNSVEGFFSIFKRGMKGVYQHCQEKHLHRYLSEYDFRYNNRVALGVNDEARAVIALKGVVGKRLTYRTVGEANG